MGIGDWGLGIGDWAQSPIPNPQSPIPNPHFINKILFFIIIIKKININYFLFKKLILNNYLLFFSRFINKS
jgi:hypothetical protein